MTLSEQAIASREKGKRDIHAPVYVEQKHYLEVLTFMDRNDVGVIEGRHDLNLSPDMDKILLILYFVFPDRLDSNLKMESWKAVSSVASLLLTLGENLHVSIRHRPVLVNKVNTMLRKI